LHRHDGLFERVVAPVNNGVKFEKFLHTAWEVPDWDRTTAFYQQVLGLQSVGLDRQSRWILPISGSLSSLLGTDAAVRQQLSTACASRWNPSTTSYVRETTRLRWGVELRDDLLRHAPSGSIGVNMKIRREGSLSNSVLRVTTVTCCGDHDRSQIGYRPQLYGHSTRLCPGSHARMRCVGARSADRWKREVVVGATGLSGIGSAVNAAVWAAERPRPAK
jgi:hypothetical protein